MNIVDKAWEILRKFEPNLALESFLEKLKPTFDQNRDLSKNEIVIKMLEYIKNDKPFGETIATAAEKALNQQVSVEQASKNIESYDPTKEKSQTTETLTQTELQQ